MATEILPAKGPFSYHGSPPKYVGEVVCIEVGDMPETDLRRTEESLGQRFSKWDAPYGAYHAARTALKELWQNADRYGYGPREACIARTIGGVAISLLDRNRNDGQEPKRVAPPPEDITDIFSEDIDSLVDAGGNGRGLDLISQLPEISGCGSLGTPLGNRFWVEVTLQSNSQDPLAA